MFFIYKGELETAMNHFRKGLKYDPEHHGCKTGYRTIKKINTYSAKAAKSLEGKDYPSAIKHLINLISVDENHRIIATKALVDLADAYRHNKQYTEAKEVASRVISRDAKSHQGYRIQGQIHMDCDEFEEAAQQ